MLVHVNTASLFHSFILPFYHFHEKIVFRVFVHFQKSVTIQVFHIYIYIKVGVSLLPTRYVGFTCKCASVSQPCKLLCSPLTELLVGCKLRSNPIETRPDFPKALSNLHIQSLLPKTRIMTAYHTS